MALLFTEIQENITDPRILPGNVLMGSSDRLGSPICYRELAYVAMNSDIVKRI